MVKRTELNPSDLFVVLEKAFRRRAPDCRGCTFTIPYAQPAAGSDSEWTVLLTHHCSEKCRAILEEILARARSEYRLAG
jgi:hypothetical protein